jgi:hypothetical protein
MFQRFPSTKNGILRSNIVINIAASIILQFFSLSKQLPVFFCFYSPVDLSYLLPLLTNKNRNITNSAVFGVANGTDK